MENKNVANLFSGSFMSELGHEVKIEIPLLCEKLNRTKNGQICYIQNLLITTWGSLDDKTTFSCSYNVILNSYLFNEDNQGNSYYPATVNQVTINNSTDLFYISPPKNEIGIEIYPKYNTMDKRMEGNDGKIKITLLSQNKNGELVNIPENIQIFWSILILG